MTKNLIIPKSELDNRWKSVKRYLIKYNYDAILIPLGVNFNYFFGKEGKPSERLLVGIIPRDEDPFIVSPLFEKSNIEISTGLDDYVTWQETESPYEKVASEFNARKIGKNIAVDPKLWYGEIEKLIDATGFTFKSADIIIEGLRAIKSEWEIKQLKLAAEYSSNGILNAIDRLNNGITEKEFLAIVQKEMSELSGSVISFGLVQFGENSAIPHGMASQRKLQNDEVVLIDAGTSVNGYQGDITITIPYGNPTDFKNVYDIVYQANRLAFEADKEGVIACDLDKIAREYIESKGFGKYFTHRLGHGLGMEVHESPYIVGTNQSALIQYNCHTIEPGIYLPNKFGIRIEDDVVVQKNNSSRLYDTPRHNF